MRLTAVLAALLVSGIIALGGPQVRKRWSADGQYRLAERLYQAGDNEKAEIACQRALKWNPSHAPAKALFMELRFILWQSASTSATGEIDRVMKGSLVRHQQTLVGIDTAFMRADRALMDGDPAEAEKELRKILEYAKWMPTGMEIETRVKRAHALLESIEGYRCER